MRSLDQPPVENAAVARERRVERIKAAIDALPKKANATAAEQRLAFLRLLDTVERVLRLDQPKFRPISQKAISAESDGLARHAKALKSHIDEMHSSALYEVERRVPFINSTEFHGWLRLIVDAVGQIDRSSRPARHLVLVEGKDCALVAPLGGSKKPGRVFNGVATHLAGAACAAYEECTGKRATITTDPKMNERRGSFVKFVRDIFEAAGVDANVANYAKQAADIRRKVFGDTAVK